ncbi:glycoside hydrolase family 130 protein [Mucilaginibacter sp. UR6-1]|uniref:glycoside hydrolase family 130 protein n=1 Tax=Mucilaginibacter sp. UR6-1 TaxID=1435643 RepID=UPI001E58944C|nr:glycoside hydrolase family 130 protein [Mucilaginibacter sp. UR6-1]MCC8408196.1 glycoside hydrolase family 130 protein [Mucilaginibacter sp. UR6-1]
MKNNLIKLNVAILLLLAGSCAFAQQTVSRLPDWALGGFARPENTNPIISPDTTTRFFDPVLKKQVGWESNDTFNPGAAVHNGKIVVLYRSEDKSGVGIGYRTSRLGYAASTDGLHFKRSKVPVFYPANDSQKKYEWPGGCEDPRVAVTANGTYVVFYTQWNRHTPRLGVATSKDLKKWTKHGPIFEDAYKGKFVNIPHKSASIITKLVNGKQVVAKIKGKYWMYWGELSVYAATSTNLVDWTPVVNSDGTLKALFSPRKGYFDSELTECGPPAVLTDKGIVLLYNGKNKSNGDGDSRFTLNSYCAGQALFDKNDPLNFKERLDVPFMRPMASFEKSGQYPAGTVFLEGLVYFKRKWYLYYGAADSRVCVAVYDPVKPSLPDPIE